MDEKKLISAFGKVVKFLREEKGLSQEALAYHIDSHPTHISRLENGHKQPTLLTIFKISEAFSISPGELMDLVQKD